MVPGDLGLGWNIDQTSSEKCRATKSHSQRQPHPSSYPTMTPGTEQSFEPSPVHPGPPSTLVNENLALPNYCDFL